MRFRCSRCDEVHEGLPDLAFDAPYYYHTVPEAERSRRCTLSSDLCSIDDEDFFIRGCLDLPIAGREETFAWGVWMSVSRANFDQYVEHYDDPDQSRLTPFVGWLSVRLPGYPDTLKLVVRAHLNDGDERPSFELEPTDHPLAVDQRDGIPFERLREIIEASLHPPAQGA